MEIRRRRGEWGDPGANRGGRRVAGTSAGSVRERRPRGFDANSGCAAGQVSRVDAHRRRGGRRRGSGFGSGRRGTSRDAAGVAAPVGRVEPGAGQTGGGGRSFERTSRVLGDVVVEGSARVRASRRRCGGGVGTRYVQRFGREAGGFRRVSRAGDVSQGHGRGHERARRGAGDSTARDRGCASVAPRHAQRALAPGDATRPPGRGGVGRGDPARETARARPRRGSQGEVAGVPAR